ncbi:MAG: winged helix-turn-helix transcriptional regulator [Nanoarchaeota archaeon]|jgi:Lrp/AsnC family leucine-responsive transcriptional regulator|nr:winged helix-turn-helix transcriptional regulator [Nanoarchaeota archaeon]
MNINIKDKKILHELEKDARITNSQIAKKVGLSKDAVGYRIKQLEEKELIRGYRAIVDVNRLGYNLFRVYFKFSDFSNPGIKEMIDYLKKEKRAWWIAKLDGNWDFAFAFFAKSNKEFHDFYSEFSIKFRKNIKEKMIVPIIYYREFSRKYLTNSKETRQINLSEDIYYATKKELELLRLISKHGKMSLVELSEKLVLDIKTIKSKLKKLEDEKVILGYKVDLDVSKLGRDFYTVEMELNDYSKYEEIAETIRSLQESISWAISIGGYDLEFDLEIENTQQYYQAIDKLKSKFPEIREVRYFRVIENYKITYMPEE